MRTVYFIAGGGRLKVGIATDAQKRVKAIAAYLHEPLELIGTIPGNFKTERHVQRALKKFHLKGEWFKDCPESRRIALKFIEQPELVLPIRDTEAPFVPHKRTDAEWSVMFAKLVKLIWPHDGLRELASLAERPESECESWLAGGVIPPMVIRRAFAMRVFEFCEPISPCGVDSNRRGMSRV